MVNRTVEFYAEWTRHANPRAGPCSRRQSLSIKLRADPKGLTARFTVDMRLVYKVL
jgi:hypothetical protein